MSAQTKLPPKTDPYEKLTQLINNKEPVPDPLWVEVTNTLCDKVARVLKGKLLDPTAQGVMRRFNMFASRQSSALKQGTTSVEELDRFLIPVLSIIRSESFFIHRMSLFCEQIQRNHKDIEWFQKHGFKVLIKGRDVGLLNRGVDTALKDPEALALYFRILTSRVQTADSSDFFHEACSIAKREEKKNSSTSEVKIQCYNFAEKKFTEKEIKLMNKAARSKNTSVARVANYLIRGDRFFNDRKDLIHITATILALNNFVVFTEKPLHQYTVRVLCPGLVKLLSSYLSYVKKTMDSTFRLRSDLSTFLEEEKRRLPVFIRQLNQLRVNHYFSNQLALCKRLQKEADIDSQHQLDEIKDFHKKTVDVIGNLVKIQERVIDQQIASMKVRRRKTSKKIQKVNIIFRQKRKVSVQRQEKSNNACSSLQTQKIVDSGVSTLRMVQKGLPFFYHQRVSRWLKNTKIETVRTFQDKGESPYSQLDQECLRLQSIFHGLSPYVDCIFNEEKNFKKYTLPNSKGFYLMAQLQFSSGEKKNVMMTYGISKEKGYCYHRHCVEVSDAEIVNLQWNESLQLEEQEMTAVEKGLKVSAELVKDDLNEGWKGDLLEYDSDSMIYRVTDRRNRVVICVLPLTI